MQNAAGGGIEVQAVDLNDAYRSVVSDLVSLVGHVQASLKLIESAVARETSGNHDTASNIIVLDDLTPRYAKASAALQACDLRLGITLHFLLDSGTSMRAAEALAASPPALSVVRA